MQKSHSLLSCPTSFPQGIGKEGHMIWSIGLEKQWTFLPENDFKLGLRSRLHSERIPRVLFSLVFIAGGSVICVLRKPMNRLTKGNHLH